MASFQTEICAYVQQHFGNDLEENDGEMEDDTSTVPTPLQGKCCRQCSCSMRLFMKRKEADLGVSYSLDSQVRDYFHILLQSTENIMYWFLQTTYSYTYCTM